MTHRMLLSAHNQVHPSFHALDYHMIFKVNYQNTEEKFYKHLWYTQTYLALIDNLNWLFK
jgi:hypothetical protein